MHDVNHWLVLEVDMTRLYRMGLELSGFIDLNLMDSLYKQKTQTENGVQDFAQFRKRIMTVCHVLFPLISKNEPQCLACSALAKIKNSERRTHKSPVQSKHF